MLQSWKAPNSTAMMLALQYERKLLSKSSAERIAAKIWMITRRAMEVVARDYDAKECNEVVPKSVARGTRRSGNRVASGGRTVIQAASWAPASRFEVRKALLRPPRSRSRRRLSRISSRKAKYHRACEEFIRWFHMKYNG
ncbi:MAG: hypothetical protein J0H48_08410 [Nitrosospira multiformis]|nr:hypothetical protein [Nitrosospira multiformis]